MRFSIALVAAVAAVPAMATKYVTETVDSYTTFCPEATTITYKDKTYTATASQTLTLTDGPFTVTRQITEITKSACGGDCDDTVSILPILPISKSKSKSVESTGEDYVSAPEPTAPYESAPYPTATGITTYPTAGTGTNTPVVPTSALPLEGSANVLAPAGAAVFLGVAALLL